MTPRGTSPSSPPTSPSSGGSTELYGDIENLEWYVGIFAEDHPEDQMMGDLLTAMVGYDAFTQALTNPVLAPQVFTEATFTRAGLKIIRRTRSLQQILGPQRRRSRAPPTAGSPTGRSAPGGGGARVLTATAGYGPLTPASPQRGSASTFG